MISALPPLFIFTYIVLLGAAVGSFVNVIIARLPTGTSIVRPRSRCPKCQTPIAWYDNIPLASYVILRGRCRHCGVRIALRYFLVELLMAALAAALFLRFGPSWQLVVWLPTTAALLAIVFLDIDHFWVPDVITYPTMAFAAVGSFLPGGVDAQGALWGVVPALLLWTFAWLWKRLTGREGMGLGDVKLLALIGLLVGILPALSVLFLAAVQGSVIGLFVVVLGGHKPQTNPSEGVAPPDDEDSKEDEDDWRPHPRAIPFGPFLVLACFEVVLLPHLFGELPQRLGELLR